MLLYDSLGGYKGLKRHRHLTRRGALKIAPALKRDSLVGAIQYYDAKVDDARHTLTSRARPPTTARRSPRTRRSSASCARARA